MDDLDRVITPIYRKYLEFDITRMCNLKCFGCNRDSPFIKNHHSSFEKYAEDIKALSRVMVVEKFRILGGEPLLSKNLIDYLIVARESGMFKKIGICTNGILLKKQKDELFRHLDYVDVSIYPGITFFSVVKGELQKRQAANPNLEFQIKPHNKFRPMNLRFDNDDLKALQVYGECKITHDWSCHTFENGFYYKCFKPLIQEHYDKVRGIHRNYRQDGIPIHEPNLTKRLLAYINDPNPLDHCKACLGSSGEKYKYKQISNPQETLKIT